MSLSILQELRALGVEVIPQGGNLIIRPASKVPPELKERLRACKAEVLAVLARPTLAQPVETPECRHCEGKGECACPACTLRRTSEPTPCSMCRWEDHRLWLAATRPRGCWHCEARRLDGEVGPCSNCEAKAVAVQ